MSKVILTQEQADAIERWENGTQLLKAAVVGLLKHGEDEPIAEMTTETLAKAIYIGYEVEPEFEEGDWITSRDGSNLNGYWQSDIEQVDNVDGEWIRYNQDCNSIHRSRVRLSTSYEISKEKERRFWAKHGRKPWELRTNDILAKKETMGFVRVYFVRDDKNVMLEGGFLKSTKNITIDKLKEEYHVVCFAEDRKDVGVR